MLPPFRLRPRRFALLTMNFFFSREDFLPRSCALRVLRVKSPIRCFPSFHASPLSVAAPPLCIANHELLFFPRRFFAPLLCPPCSPCKISDPVLPKLPSFPPF